MIVDTVVLLTIIAYMFNGKLGCLLFLFAMTMIIMQKDNMYYKLFRLCIISLPFSFIGVLGMDTSHMLNWTMVFIIFTIFYVIYKKNGKLGIDNKALIIVLFLYISLMITCAFTIEGEKTIVEIIQISMMLITILFVWCNGTSITIDTAHSERLMDEFANICVITAIGTIFQWVMYRMADMELGYIVLTANGTRVICNCLYKGMSVLSIFLGTGAVFLILQFGIKSAKAVIGAKIGIILAGIVVNTSRTGLAGIAIVFALYVAVGFVKKKKIDFFVLGAFGLAGITMAGYKLAATRGNIFDENGRIATWIAGISIWKNNIRSFMFGAGFENSIWVNVGGMTSHNMLIQSLAQCGVVGTFLCIVLFIMYYSRIKRTPYVYVMWYLIITGMMITDFYANPFTTIAMSLIVIACSAKRKDEVIR